MTIFKVERETFDSVRVGNQLFYVKNKVLMIEDLSNMESLPQANLDAEGKQVLMNQPQNIYYNHFNSASHDILINYEGEEGYTILVSLNKNLSKNTNVVQKKIDSAKGAVFIAKEKICVLSKSKNLFIYLFDGRNKQLEWASKYQIQKIFQATLGKILIKSGDDILLFDIATKEVINKVLFSNCKNVYWSSNMNYVALASKTMVMIWTKDLIPLCTSKESTKFKSGWFDNENGFIYSTYSQLKYLMFSDKMNNSSDSKFYHGIFKSTDNPVYICGYVNKNCFYINRDGKVIREDVNSAEYDLKVALKNKRNSEIISILKKGQLSGNSIIHYLKQENCHDIALLFEKDPKVRFSLSLSSGNIQEAYKIASEMKCKDVYLQLAEQSLLQGYQNVAEKSYQSIKAFNKLSFFYAAQGWTTKLK